jgi:hypothetical protein
MQSKKQKTIKKGHPTTEYAMEVGGLNLQQLHHHHHHHCRHKQQPARLSYGGFSGD